jgi:DNA primase
MNRIPKSQVDLVIQAQDIAFWAKKYIKLDFKGPNAFGLCPFHSEKTPSFSINTHKNFFYCFGCQKSGNSVDLVMHFESLMFHEAIVFMAEALGIKIELAIDDSFDAQYEDMLKVSRAYYAQLTKSKHAIDYLKSRKITGESAKHFQLGLSIDQSGHLMKQTGANQQSLIELGLLLKSKRDTSSVYCRFRQRLMFPVHNMQGQIIGFGGRDLSKDGDVKYLNSAESKIFNKRNALYGLFQARKLKAKCAYVVEGYFDVIMLWQHGLYGAVAPMGTAITGSQIAILNRYFDHIYFCFDGDRAGINASEKALIKTLNVMRDGLKVYFITLPQGHDPDSFVAEHGLDAFQSLIDQSPDLFEYIKLRYFSKCTGPSQVIDMSLKIKPWVQEMPNSMTKQALIQFVAKETSLGPEWFEQEEIIVKKSVSNSQARSSKSTLPLPSIWYNLLVCAQGVELNQDLIIQLKSHCPDEHQILLQALLDQKSEQNLTESMKDQSFSDIGFSVKQYHQVLINYHDQNHVMDTNNLIIQLTINYLETKINTLISRITHDSDNQQRLTLNSLIHEKNSLKRQLKLNLQQGT